MKEQWCISKEKLVTLEEGSSHNGENECVKPTERNNACKQAIQCAKLILYLELLLFVGWACYSIWQTYRIQPMEVKVIDIIREPKSQSLFEEQSMHETSTIASKRFYKFEDFLTEMRDAVDEENIHLQKHSPSNQNESFNNENAESWPDLPSDTSDSKQELNAHRVKQDNSHLSQAAEDIMTPISPFSFFPSIPSTEDYECNKELRNSESTEEMLNTSDYDINEESQQSAENEEIAVENFMLLSLLVQNAVRDVGALEDVSKKIDPKFAIKGEDSAALKLQEEIDCEQENSEEKSISTKTVDNHESDTFNISDNIDQSIPEDINEPEQEETLIKSNGQMHQSIVKIENDSYGQSPVEERKYEEKNGEIPKVPFHGWNADIIKPYSDTGRFSLENESDAESEWDSFGKDMYDWPSKKWLVKRSINSEKVKSNELMKMYMEYLEQELKESKHAVPPLLLQ